MTGEPTAEMSEALDACVTLLLAGSDWRAASVEPEVGGLMLVAQWLRDFAQRAPRLGAVRLQRVRCRLAAGPDQQPPAARVDNRPLYVT